MEPLDGHIPVRSERQAMDWSLVLASQGIETAIERAPEEDRLFLAVNPLDRERALGSIRQYEQENRRRRWQRPVRWTGLLMDWRALFCLLPLFVFFILDDMAGSIDFKTTGLMDSAAVRSGQWWRLFTAVTLHADLGHLASNFTTGVLLLGLAMGSYGVGKALLASFLAGAGGNLAAFLLLGVPHRSLGASGMVLGALGLLTMHSFKLWHQGEDYRRLVGRAVGAGLLLLVLFGLNPRTDVTAHVGGFITGAVLGLVLVFLPVKWTESRVADAIAGWLCLVLVLATWARALA